MRHSKKRSGWRLSDGATHGGGLYRERRGLRIYSGAQYAELQHSALTYLVTLEEKTFHPILSFFNINIDCLKTGAVFIRGPYRAPPSPSPLVVGKAGFAISCRFFPSWEASLLLRDTSCVTSFEQSTKTRPQTYCVHL